MTDKHEHYWNYENVVYDATPNKCTVRRWCSGCGLLQHSHTTGRWYASRVGPEKMFGEYPEGYDTKFTEEPTHD
ncbi:hypothetical protein LCGC14_2907700 [marine sediment metagenome]|uniref:Uncharacterized protein n=1 Tax=marine sediment metagenome TaxID=412755 RepID=A0A0F8XSY8_9ZZZZ